MTGAISTNGHGGFQSELLAQYVFSSWGTVVATPNPEDHGIDLHCNLVEAVGKRAWARAPYTVQVKSNMDPWEFNGIESVRWLIEHPLPLFLCVVDKPEARLRVYHTSPRFYVWSLRELPDRLILRPTTDEIGQCTQWEGQFDFSLSAPILDVSVDQLLDDEFMQKAKATLEFWIGVDNRNLTLLRTGLLRFRMPHEYKPNDCEISAWMEQGRTAPTDEQLKKGVRHLAEALDCIGSQFFYRKDLLGAVKMGLLYRHVFKTFPAFFDERDSARALTPMYTRLNEEMDGVRKDYLFAGIDRIEQIVEQVIPSSNKPS